MALSWYHSPLNYIFGFAGLERFVSDVIPNDPRFTTVFPRNAPSFDAFSGQSKSKEGKSCLNLLPRLKAYLRFDEFHAYSTDYSCIRLLFRLNNGK